MSGMKEQSVLGVYQEYLKAGELAYQFSLRAQRAIFFPREVCPYSGSTALEWRVSSGLGRIYSTTRVHRRGGAPYNVSLIDMDEGFRLMSKVVTTSAQPIEIGAAVRFLEAGEADGVLFPIFTLDAEPTV